MSASNDGLMKLGLTSSLKTQVQQKFAQARVAGDLIFSDTELSILRSRQGVPFQLRFCPALAVKPKEKVPDWSKPKSKVDPFANPGPQLLVSQIPTHSPSHILVINKFPVIPNHFIIATKANLPQTDILDEADLSATYACINAWEDDSGDDQHERLFAFFNSGDHSGASQAHRHLQFLPSEDMLLGSEGNHGWKLLIRSMKSKAHARLPLLHNPALPFAHFATKLEPGISSASLYSKYIMLMKAALAASKSLTGDLAEDLDDPLEIEKNGQTTFSYNLAFTTDLMAICPRKSESAPIPGLSDDHEVSINGTILGGTLMVKNETEWNTLRQNPHMLDGMLGEIGYPRRLNSLRGPSTDYENGKDCSSKLIAFIFLLLRGRLIPSLIFVQHFQKSSISGQHFQTMCLKTLSLLLIAPTKWSAAK